LICFQWQAYILVSTLRLAVYTLFGKTRSNLGKNFLHPQKYAHPHTYGGKCIVTNRLMFAAIKFGKISSDQGSCI